MELGLQLLMRDGAARVVFHPRLNADQYAELMRLVDLAATRVELKTAVTAAAKRWGVEVEYEEVGV
jgi:hypothetical protein